MEFLSERPPWYLAGPGLGLVVVALLAVLNERIGVLGGYSELVERATRRRSSLGWKAWFLFGIVGGAVLFAALGGSAPADGYGWLTRTFDGAALPAAGALLVAAGACIGFGAKMGGGCTSGNGLGGSALGSLAAMVATMTFMGTAIAATLAIDALVGGGP